MAHRISAGALVVRGGQILLVHHVKPARYDFWAAPGGGVEGNESLEAAARREVLEETGLAIAVLRLAYMTDLWSSDDRAIQFWFLAEYASGSLDVLANPAAGESIVEAAWFDLDHLPDGHVFPEPLRTHFRADLEAGFATPVRLPLRQTLF